MNSDNVNKQKMRKKLLLLTVIMMSALAGFSQEKTAVVPHRIIFQVQTGDTLAHKALMKQLNNIISVSPDAKVEVLCHGPGIEMLTKSKSSVADKVKGLNAKGISFVACEFTMSEKNIAREEILTDATTVKYGILEIVSKQEQGWSYIKAGF
jgi:uncharacterized protein